MPVVCFFVSIRWTDSMSKFTVYVFVLAGALCIFVMYVEVMLCCIMPDKSDKFLLVMRRKNTRSSTVGRKIRACKLIKWAVGKPFYTLSNFSFLIFMEQLLSFLSTLLLSVE